MKQLRALVTVADTGNVTRASAILHLVQPAVTRQLKLLEEDVGTPLFQRSRQGMALTDAGRALVEHARRILDEVARARAEIRASTGELSGLVTIGLLPSTAALLSSELVACVAKEHPGVRLRLTVAYAGHLQRWMEAGEIDATLLYDPKPSPGIQVKPLLSETLCVVGPASAGLNPRKPMAMKKLASRKVVLPSAPHGLRTLIEEAAVQAGVQLDVVLETNDLGVQKQLVTDGVGYTILPATAVAADVASGLLSTTPLKNPTVDRKIVLAAPAARPPTAATRVVMDALMGCMQQAVRAGQWAGAKWLA
ncbi:MAG: LysR substrate-binding domain-containing protein [Ramlibacter sp.]|nr:LysR substrate-binding domain-containing protein [Ramlibacter sp.]